MVVGTGRRHGEQVTGPDVAGQPHVRDEDVSCFAVPPDYGHRVIGRAGVAAEKPDAVVSVVQRVAGVVAHPAVDGDEGPHARQVFDHRDFVQGDDRRTDDRPAGFDGQSRHGKPVPVALVVETSGHARGESAQVEAGIVG